MDTDKLKDFQLALVNAPELQPKPDGTTFCNYGAQRVANFFGVHELDGLDADQMCKVLMTSKNWAKKLGVEASLAAQNGNLAFAAMTSEQLGEGHGHIASLFPAPMEMSGSLGHPVPMLANIGKICGITKESLDFPVAKGEANYYQWIG